MWSMEQDAGRPYPLPTIPSSPHGYSASSGQDGQDGLPVNPQASDGHQESYNTTAVARVSELHFMPHLIPLRVTAAASLLGSSHNT